MERQIPWRLNRRSAPIAGLCLLLGIGCALIPLSADRTGDGLRFALFAALVLAVASWLAWCAVTWHVDIIRRATGLYVERHLGLLFGLPMWSMQSFQLFRQTRELSGPPVSLFWLLFALLLPAPFALWGGIAFRYMVVRFLGRGGTR